MWFVTPKSILNTVQITNVLVVFPMKSDVSLSEPSSTRTSVYTSKVITPHVGSLFIPTRETSCEYVRKMGVLVSFYLITSTDGRDTKGPPKT